MMMMMMMMGIIMKMIASRRRFRADKASASCEKHAYKTLSATFSYDKRLPITLISSNIHAFLFHEVGKLLRHSRLDAELLATKLSLKEHAPHDQQGGSVLLSIRHDGLR